MNNGQDKGSGLGGVSGEKVTRKTWLVYLDLFIQISQPQVLCLWY